MFVYIPYFTDEIAWPEGDDALPADSQDLITKLLRQSPLERLGTGACSSMGIYCLEKRPIMKISIFL